MYKFSKIYIGIAFGGILLAQASEAAPLSDLSLQEGWYISSGVGITGGRWTKKHEKQQFSLDDTGVGFSFTGGYIFALKSGLVLGGEARCDFFANTKKRGEAKLEQCSPAVAVIVGYGCDEMRGIIGITLGGAFVRSKIGNGLHHGRKPHMGLPPWGPHRGPRPNPRGPHMRPPHRGPQGPFAHIHEEKDISQLAPELGFFYTTKVGENMFLRTDVRYAFGLKTEIQTSRMMSSITVIYHF